MPQVKSPANVWLDRIPNLEDGRRNPGLNPIVAAKLFDEILSSGGDAIADVIDSLGESDDGKDWKTRLLLHGLLIHTGSAERGKDRERLESVYSLSLDDERSESAKTFLAMQLQWFATAKSVPALAAQFSSPDIRLVNAAAAALTAIGKPAIQSLKQAQANASGDAKVAIGHALIQIQRQS